MNGSTLNFHLDRFPVCRHLGKELFFAQGAEMLVIIN